MKKHPLNLIEKIKIMRTEGKTLGDIVQATGLPKTTIYFHLRKIPKRFNLTQRLKEVIKIKNKKIGDAKRGKSFKTYQYKKPNIWTPDFVMLVAHLMFDGELKYASCVYNNRSQALIDRFIRLMKENLGVTDYKFHKKEDGVMRVSYHHVEIASFMKIKSLELLEYIQTAPIKHKIAFLRAFYDDEGSMCFDKNKRVVRGYQHSHERLLLLQKLLADLGIESSLDNRHVEIKIGRRENLLKFQKLINFSEGVAINPARSNSIWKRPLQKREILQMALASYKLAS